MKTQINEKYFDFIGKGSFGDVYKIDDKAIKIFKLEDIKERIKDKYYTNEITDEVKREYENYLKGIIKEVENMKICSNKNEYSVKCYDYFKNEKILGIIMEYCDNNLKQILKSRKKGFNIEEIYEIMYQLNETFKIMKKNNIVHRDIKLENILVKYDNNNNILNFICKLSDYGISKRLNDFTICKTYTGTVTTMAPEILKAEEEEIKEYSDKCDLWSIGVIIYELYFKKPPYNGINASAILKLIKNNGQKLLQKTGYYPLDNLIENLLIENPLKRISCDEYFNHLFFKDEIKLIYKLEGKKD